MLCPVSAMGTLTAYFGENGKFLRNALFPVWVVFFPFSIFEGHNTIANFCNSVVLKAAKHFDLDHIVTVQPDEYRSAKKDIGRYFLSFLREN